MLMIRKSRYSLLAGFIAFFLVVSFIIRSVLLLLSVQKSGIPVSAIPAIYLKGMVFDTAVALFFSIGYSLYLLLLPQRWNNTLFNRIFTYTFFTLVIFIIVFSFFAEFTFWNEFESRFNFIAVDYLVYTFEVINNINQSYPLHYLITGMLLLTAIVFMVFYKRKAFDNSFQSVTCVKTRIAFTGAILSGAVICLLCLRNSWADKSVNHYQNELSKAGIFSFFAAFKNNELNYYDFYRKTNTGNAFDIIRKELASTDARFTGSDHSIRQQVKDNGDTQQPNVIMVTIESFSADFMARFGNQEHLTPNLDSLANKSILFTDMYATGTRTVRGMEALTLAVPPTPGNSIVRRQNNSQLFTVGTIFKQAGYERRFFYGGDGYFDNMNNYFGNNGFDITDKGGRLMPGETLNAKRTVIPDNNISFQNAWGICDEDLYNAVIHTADTTYKKQPFFYFVMTTSNHRPYTYPEKKIDIPSGSGREGAVKYTDYAIGQFIKKIQSKPWFNNTIIIFVADHCASSAGKNEIDIAKYHIPCMIYNVKNSTATTIDTQCSQIDLFPTLFGILNWKYEANWYGKDVLQPGYQPRALIATYQKLGYLQRDQLVILGPQQQTETYYWNKSKNEQQATKPDDNLVQKAIAYYQTAYYLYKNGGMQEETPLTKK
ncbi:MAG: sulfatase-like hydrolase/transferase [Chitinophagaceae bacterium]